MRYIGTYVQNLTTATRLSLAVGCPVTVGHYLNRYPNGVVSSDEDTRALMLTNDEFICCVLRKCDPVDLPKSQYVLDLNNGTLTVSDGYVVLDAHKVKPVEYHKFPTSDLKKFLARTLHVMPMHGRQVQKECGPVEVRILGSVLTDQQIDELLEVS